MTAAQHKGVKPLKVALKNLGCRVNRAELDAIAASLEQAGCELVGEDEASIVVVNTCAVTGEAEAKARKSLRHYASLPQVQSVVATGCMATLFADEVASLGEKMQVEVLKTQVASCVLAEAGRLGLADAVAGAGKGLQDRPGGSLQVHESAPSASASQIAVDSSLLPVTSEAQGTVTPTGRMRPGIKIQDGCDNRCTYCIVWKARGPARSLSPHEAVAAVSQAVEQGAGEVVLTGIDLGRYDGGIGLAGLLDQLLVKTKVGRIRLSSVEPVELSDDLLRLMGDSSGVWRPSCICLCSLVATPHWLAWADLTTRLAIVPSLSGRASWCRALPWPATLSWASLGRRPRSSTKAWSFAVPWTMPTCMSSAIPSAQEPQPPLPQIRWILRWPMSARALCARWPAKAAPPTLRAVLAGRSWRLSSVLAAPSLAALQRCWWIQAQALPLVPL